MKKNNTMKKKQQMWVKGITGLTASLCLQAHYCRQSDANTALIGVNPVAFEQELRNKIDISQSSQGVDLLHAAVDAGDLKKTGTILARVASDKEGNFSYANADFPNSLDSQGRLALNKAIQGGKTAIAIALIRSKWIDLLKTDRKGRSPFHMAARCKNKKVMQALHASTIDPRDSRKYTKKQVNEALLKKTKGSKGYNVFTAAFLPKHRIFSVEAIQNQLNMYVYVSNKFEPFLTMEEKKQIPIETANHVICSLDAPDKPTTYLLPEGTKPSLTETPKQGNVSGTVPVPPPMPVKPDVPLKPQSLVSAKQDDPRTELLAAIRKGTLLKPAQERGKSQTNGASAPTTHMAMLVSAFQKRLPATQGPIGEDVGDESSVSDEEWDD